MLDSALALASRGWPVFPCRPGSKVPATKHGVKDATTAAEQVRAWWSRRDYNIGIATGRPSGLYVLDVDGATGVETLIESGFPIPTHTLYQSTPRGGYHFLFRWREGLRNSAGKLGAGLDTRGDGGYIVVAPSQVEGVGYSWLDGGTAKPCGIPGWLLRWALPTPLGPTEPQERNLPPVDNGVGGHPGTSEGSGSREKYALAALRSECSTVASAVPSTRNHTLNSAAYKLGTLVGADLLGTDEVTSALVAAGLACGLAEREIRRTIWSGLEAGVKHPRQIA